mmetsp:Transcript_2389/g.5073  ORF Transcript_2389/g.5073 Transcript_2389/m.5073 type:complete len:750 (-) Transcript_2389:38-2287(-)
MASSACANAPSQMEYKQYREFRSWYNIEFDDKWKERKWPSQRLQKAPRWCSVDLRDGNQALINPMNHEKKLMMFQHLVKMGFKEIEVGFPAASQTDFDFCRYIVENNCIPDDVAVQVLTQCREPLIKRTIESLKGAKNVILHMYNSTSELQRRVVFEKPREDIKQLAVDAAKLLKSMADQELVPLGGNVRYEYSPESFTGTELDFALDVCEAVADILGPNPEDKVILNLPATVEMSTPNVYADQIEWMHCHFKNREKVILSLHPHNDRGCGVACAELGVFAGADRVEGCLFGNGERTGNVCLVTLGMNLFSQGIDPEMDLRNIQETIDVAEYCNELRVPERHPWAGQLVYTAFSGSHQDAIKKGMAHMMKQPATHHWEVPYLPINPLHIGRSYEAVVRVNSQSGKGGVAYILEHNFGIAMPKDAQAEFSQVVQKITDQTSLEIKPDEIYKAFEQTYLQQKNGFQLLDFSVSTKLVALAELEERGVVGLPKALQVELVALCKPLTDRKECYPVFRANYVDVKAPLELVKYEISEGSESVSITVTVKKDGAEQQLSGSGNGPIAAYMSALKSLYSDLELHSYGEHDIQHKADAEALCYISVSHNGGADRFGIGISENTTRASLQALTAAVNRAININGKQLDQAETLESLCSIAATIQRGTSKTEVLGSGNGPVAAFVSAMKTYFKEAEDLKLVDYSQTARGANKTGHESEAVCAIACTLGGKKRYGMGLDVNTNTASAKAVLSAMSILLP